MSNLAIFNNFTDVSLITSKFARKGMFEVWDADLHDGAIRPFKCPEVICDGGYGDVGFIYSSPECECLGFANGPAIQGFCPTQHFTILNGGLYQTEIVDCDLVFYTAGSPIPPLPLVVAPIPECGACGASQVAYVTTIVTEHVGMEVEGPPSPPTIGFSTNSDAPNIHLALTPLPAGPAYKAVNIYRTTSSFEEGSNLPVIGDEWVLVAQVPHTTTTFHDMIPISHTGKPLTTYDPMIFPAPEGILHLTRTEDGIVVADKHRLYISINGQPMFSYDGIVNIEDEIRDIQAVDNNILVLTDKSPVIVSYSNTQGLMSIERETLHRNTPLLNKKSVSRYGDRIYYASEYSLYVWQKGRFGSNVNSIITELMTPHQWKILGPETVVGTAHEYGYILTSGKLGHSMMVEVHGDGTDTALQTHLMPISYINAECFSLSHDGHILYKEGDNLYQWDYRDINDCNPALQDSDTREMCKDCCPYWVRLYFDSEGKNHFRVMRVEFDERSDYSIGVSFDQSHFGGATPLETFDVTSSRGFNIPKFTSAQTHYVTLTGCGTITEVRFATAFADLVSRDNRNLASGG